MRVLIITGAGISAESGIPTFRGKDGYWRNFDPAKLATPEAFARDPNLVWEWYAERRKWIRDAQPNAAHEAIVKLSVQAREFLLVTQNVDDLHARAEWNGQHLLPEQMVQIHGDIFVTKCSRCDFAHSERRDSDGKDADCFKQSSGIELSRMGLLKCPRCGALMRPGVVWFGEQLDAGKIDRVEDYLGRGPLDFTIVIGTTAIFGYIVDWATRTTHKLIEVNPEQTGLSMLAHECVREPAAVALPRMVDSCFRPGPVGA